MSALFLLVGVLLLLITLMVVGIRKRRLDRWLIPYVIQSVQRRACRETEDVHVLLCIADHFEPRHGGAGPETARERVQRWVDGYPELFGSFSDSDGQPPRHTFFYPVEQYDEQEVETLAGLCRQGFGEIEVHLHHEDATAEQLRSQLLEYRDLLAEQHGLLARRRHNGEVVYGFVHGDWALNNSHPQGLHCGIPNELEVLWETGCYADFTMPSAPDPTQPRRINSLYYVDSDANGHTSLDRGTDVGAAPGAGLMLIQGPLGLDWKRRKWGIVPRIENGCLQASQPPSMDRLDCWLRARAQVVGRPDWFFVKLHTHGAVETNQTVLLGEPMVQFHEALTARAAANPRFHYHYVTAREMYNLARAAEAGWTGTVGEARDFELVLSSTTSSQSSPVNGHTPTVCG